MLKLSAFTMSRENVSICSGAGLEGNRLCVFTQSLLWGFLFITCMVAIPPLKSTARTPSEIFKPHVFSWNVLDCLIAKCCPSRSRVPLWTHNMKATFQGRYQNITLHQAPLEWSMVFSACSVINTSLSYKCWPDIYIVRIKIDKYIKGHRTFEITACISDILLLWILSNSLKICGFIYF